MVVLSISCQQGIKMKTHVETIDQLAKPQRDRMAHIDLLLLCTGVAMRQDIADCYGIKSAAATRDFALYKKIAPKNLSYNKSEKRYTAGEWFSPVFEFSAGQMLQWLVGGLGNVSSIKHEKVVPSENTDVKRAISVDVLSCVSRSIYSNTVTEISYRSLSSGLTVRQIVPFVFINNGDRWHVRAYDLRNEEFRDFSLSRIIDAKQLPDRAIATQSLADDIQWNRIVELELVPHPANIQHPDTIEAEYGMRNGVLRIKIRAALAGYFLRRWNVDCTTDHGLKGKEYQLWLKNPQALYGVENLVLVPGYAPERKTR